MNMKKIKGIKTPLFSGAHFNEFIVNYTTIRDSRAVGDILFPQVNVLIAGGKRLTAGTEQYSGANGLDQDIIEITDNLTWTLGDHMFTIGTHNEFFKFANIYIRNLYGYWEFSSLDNFENGISSRYYHDFYTADPTEKWAAEFNVAQLGGYIGDKWAVLPNLFLTLGVRLDVPIINNVPTANPLVERVFVPTAEDRLLGVMVDLPDERVPGGQDDGEGARSVPRSVHGAGAEAEPSSLKPPRLT